ncbi:unnamed protein product [Cladocopium goreaui]|uniref:Protein xylosyltransferase n=1 Tax=Cladocopium goreaui TaxID=2562237 RepID=A0A9P1CJL7_9DINO|nr:unnamed protein product [Cladocopium goreaui]CAI3991884.1 unnamed protein product [Cladocopium goreaui]
MLERCLQALSKAYGYNKNMVMVSQDGDGTQTKIMAQKFHVGWRQVDTGVKSAGEKEALHYKMALQHAIEGPIKDKSVLIILEEDMVVSFDILLYFAQFQEILKWDDIFSVSAWNENAIAPFSANAQRLLRVDSFSGAVWMVSTEVMRQLLPAWPRNFWQKHLRKVTAGKQNIIPELPRVRLERTNLQSASIFVSSARDLNHADLGDLRRLAAEVYLERLITDLREATLVEELKNLPSPIKMRDSTLELNWRVHYQSSQPDNDGTWNFLARYLQLPETGQGPLLEGVSKLVWGRGFLFLVASSSRLIVKARLRPLPAEPVAPEAFQEAAPADRTGQSCSDFCTSRGGFCAASDLLFANSCEAMRTVLFCERCERNMGSDQPAVASSRSSRSYGACLYNGDILHHPITCEAAHRETRRLCVCRDVAGVLSTTKTPEPSESTSKSSKQSHLETPEPTTESSSTLAAEAAETTLKQSKEPTTESSSTLAAEAAETTLKQSKEKSSSDMVSADVDAASFARTKAVDRNQTLGRSAAVNRSRPS